MRVRSVVLILCLSLVTVQAFPEVTEEDYARMKRFTWQNFGSLIYRSSVTPNWFPGMDRFWYMVKTRTGNQFVVVEAESGKRQPAFDHEKLAEGLSKAAGKKYTAGTLPFRFISYGEDGSTLSFQVGKDLWICNLNDYTCTKGEPGTPGGRGRPMGGSPLMFPGFSPVSPDGKWRVSLKEGNLYIQSTEGGEVTALTDDAEPHFGYAGATEWFGLNFGSRTPVSILWSPDSSKFITCRFDERLLKDEYLLQYSPGKMGARPVLHMFKSVMPGEKHTPLYKPYVIDVSSREKIDLGFPLQFTELGSPIGAKDIGWAPDGHSVFLVSRTRDSKKITIYLTDLRNGQTQAVLSEEDDTPVVSYGAQNTLWFSPDCKRTLWVSWKTGWNHLYLYEGGSSTPLTSGEWNVRGLSEAYGSALVRVDEEEGWIYFYGAGREPGRNPYYLHLYRVRFDGNGLKLLTPEDATHMVTFSPSGNYFIDTYSRVDLPPVTKLRNVDGSLVTEIEQADVDDLLATGWMFPERFKVKARDGKTDIYGVIIKPSNFDPTKKYPVLDDHYGGTQLPKAPKSFVYRSYPSLAELGFIIVMIDGLGSPGRSRAFVEYSYENVGDAAGVGDHPGAIRHLAETRPYMDLDRVGIYGHSGGGMGSTRAILDYPDFFKAAASSAGNHDHRQFHAHYSERYHGLLEDDNYVDQANSTHAHKLKGKLLLVVGDMDKRVPPTATMQLIDALIKADKDFEFLLMPSTGHGTEYTQYYQRKRADFFVRHLLGETPPDWNALDQGETE